MYFGKLFFLFGAAGGRGVLCRILVPRPGIKPTLPAVGAGYPNHWKTKKFLESSFIFCKMQGNYLRLTSVSVCDFHRLEELILTCYG